MFKQEWQDKYMRGKRTNSCLVQQTVWCIYLFSIMCTVLQRIMKMGWNQGEYYLFTTNDFLIQQLIELFSCKEGHRQYYQLSELLEKSVTLSLFGNLESVLLYLVLLSYKRKLNITNKMKINYGRTIFSSLISNNFVHYSLSQ